jgi:hypothetical protein
MSPDAARPLYWSAVADVLRASRDALPLRAGGPDAPRPLSHQQQTFWPPEGTNGLYHIPMLYTIAADVDAERLQDAIRTVAARHESLRTYFNVAGRGGPRQCLLPASAISLDVVDCTPAQAELRIAAESEREFDLRRGPLASFTLLRLGPRDHRLLATFHHAIFDGWSLGIFARELSAFYAGARSLPPVLQGVDYARWQEAWSDSMAARRQREYWIEALRDMPASAADPWPGEARVIRAVHRLPERTASRLRRLAAATATTPFVIALAVFATTLQRASGRGDLPIASAAAGRTRRELLDVIGCLINAFIVRANVDALPVARTLIADLSRRSSGAFANPDLPFQDAWERLRRRFWPAQVLLMYQNMPPARLTLDGVACPQFPLAASISDYPLMLYITEDPAGACCEWYGQADFFALDDLHQLASAFEFVLSCFDEDLDTRTLAIEVSVTLRRTLRRLLRVRARSNVLPVRREAPA